MLERAALGEVAGDLFAEPLRLAAGEHAAGNRAGEERRDGDTHPCKPAKQPQLQLTTRRTGDRGRAESPGRSLARPRADDRGCALTRRRTGLDAVDGVQLGNKLELDRDDGERLPDEYGGETEQRRRRRVLDRHEDATGRTDGGRRTGGRGDD